MSLTAEEQEIGTTIVADVNELVEAAGWHVVGIDIAPGPHPAGKREEIEAR